MTSCTSNKATSSSGTIDYPAGMDGMRRGTALERERHAWLYVKPQSEGVIAEMSRFEAEMAAHEVRDSKSPLGRNAQICKLAT